MCRPLRHTRGSLHLCGFRHYWGGSAMRKGLVLLAALMAAIAIVGVFAGVGRSSGSKGSAAERTRSVGTRLPADEPDAGAQGADPDAAVPSEGKRGEEDEGD